MGYVFISYSSKERKDAEKLRDELKRSGLSTWMAPEDIPAGSNYAAELNKALMNAGCVVLLLTENSQSSRYVDREMELAVSYGRPIVPIALEDIRLNDSFRFYIGNSQIKTVERICSDDRQFALLIKRIEDLSGTPPCKEPEETKKDDEGDLSTPATGGAAGHAYKPDMGRLFGGSLWEDEETEDEDRDGTSTERETLLDGFFDNDPPDDDPDEPDSSSSGRPLWGGALFDDEDEDPDEEAPCYTRRPGGGEKGGIVSRIGRYFGIEVEDDYDEDEDPDEPPYRSYGSTGDALRFVFRLFKAMVIIAVITAAAAFVLPLKTLRIYDRATELYQEGRYEEAYDTVNTIDLDSFTTLWAERTRRISVKSLLMSSAFAFQKEDLHDLSVGDMLYFGLYEQNDNTKDGIEQIPWIVVAAEDDRILLVSKNIIGIMPYDDSSYPSSGWSQSSLRMWLNKVFLNSAFWSEYREYLLSVQVETVPSPVYGTGLAGDISQDTLFILSEEELKEYLTEDILNTCFEEPGTEWWVRTPGKYDYTAVVADGTGDLDYNGENVTVSLGVRPAMWITLGQ